jgi:multidrug efflux pump subunit AcrA (membrane-fusion protein)
MKLFIPLLVISAAVALGALTGCDQSTHAQHAHDHGEADHDELDPIRVTLFTDKVQLFMEYPHLVRGEPARFLAHLTVLETGEPIRSGTLRFKLTDPTGATQETIVDAPKRDGLFVPEWTFPEVEIFTLELTLTSPQAEDRIMVGEIDVWASHHDAIHAAEASAEAELPDLVPFLLEQQWKIGTRYERATRRTLVRRLLIPGQVIAPQGASAVVSPPVAGRLLPPPDGKLPQVGDPVQAGQVLALVEPRLPATEVAQLSANRAQVQSLETELALRELDLDTKALEVERSLIQSEARLEYARRALERADKLREKGLGAEQEHDEAIQNVRLAEAEFEGAKVMKRSYDNARERLATLRSQTSVANRDTPAAGELFQMPLEAPIAGQIVAVHHIQGEHLDAHQELFRILSTEHVWVEASVSEFDLAELLEQPGATMELPSYPGRRFDMLGAAGGRLVNIGTEIEPETRTVAVLFELPNPDGLFRVGMFADVYLETKTATEAVAIPEDAILMDNGFPLCFVLIDGETFQRRELELGVRDNGFVEVKRGVEDGERVVTQGGYLIKLAALTPEAFGHGHAH